MWGDLFRLVAEAYRIHLAHLFDPVLAIHTSLIEPLPHQITGVYGDMLPRQPLCFLLADDKRRGTVGFALTILQRRLASSPEAVYQFLKRRRQRLEKRLAEIRTEQQIVPALEHGTRYYDKEYLDGLDDAPAEEVEAIEEQIVLPHSRRSFGYLTTYEKDGILQELLEGHRTLDWSR